MTANHIDEMLGESPQIEEENQIQQEVVQEEIVEETQEEVKQEQPAIDPVKLQEERENYKRMAHAERMERKQAQEQMALMQARFEQLMQAAQPKEPEPVYEDDPLGATHAKVDKVVQSIEALQQAEAQRVQQAQFQGYVQSVASDEQSFMQQNPDYKDAVTFLQQRRVNELQALGYDSQTTMQTLAQDAFAITQRAQAMGESPASFVYKMAKQLGYSTKPAQSNIDTITAGQQVAKSVAGGAKPVNDGGIPSNLAEMTDEEFDSLFKKMAKG